MYQEDRTPSRWVRRQSWVEMGYAAKESLIKGSFIKLQ